jgi:hypothetical protein
MNRRNDPLQVVADLRPVTLDHLIEHGYARHRDADLARAAADRAAHRTPARRRRSRAGHGRPRWYLVTGAVAAAAAVAAVLLTGTPPASRHLAPPAPRAHGAAPPRAAPARFTTARQVLLTAAAHVTSAPATGRYWRVQEISGLNLPGGTKAHPYDMTLATSYDQWNPRAAGQKEYEIGQRLGTRPATPADTAAWRAAGSPTTWHSGQDASLLGAIIQRGTYPWNLALSATTAASAPGASWVISDGTVGYVEGDEAGLTAAQFRQMPTTPAGVRAVLRHDAELTFCAQHPSAGCWTVDQLVWDEALFLLEDPVSAPVRSAVFKVMASLPGVRLLGPMTDPLGRRGYGLAAGPQDPGWLNYHPVSAVVIDPGTGALLATEDIGPIPRSLECETAVDTGGTVPKGEPVLKVTANGKTFTGKCVGPSFDGRSYQGQVDEYVAVVSAGWANGRPELPSSTRHDTVSFPGLPPAQLGQMYAVGIAAPIPLPS